jgi:hypothetical protein
MVTVRSLTVQVDKHSPWVDAEPRSLQKPGCLGCGSTAAGLPSARNTAAMSGLSSGRSCTHSSPTCTHRSTSERRNAPAPATASSSSASALPSLHSFHAWWWPSIRSVSARQCSVLFFLRERNALFLTRTQTHWISNLRTYVAEEARMLAAAVPVHAPVLPAADDLEDQHAEAEHVGLHREDALHRVLRRHVPAAFVPSIPVSRRHRRHESKLTIYCRMGRSVILLCSDDFSGVRVAAVAKDPRHAEVGDLGVHAPVQQDVAGLEIPVNHPVPGVLVQVQQPPCDAKYDVEPFGPVQLRRPTLICKFTCPVCKFTGKQKMVLPDESSRDLNLVVPKMKLSRLLFSMYS